MSSTPQPICSEAAKNAIDPGLLSQQRAKLAKMQAFLFSLLNTLADASHSIDLISTQINKYHLHAEFECPDKPTSNGFHGHLTIEQIEIGNGFGLNKKLAKKQVKVIFNLQIEVIHVFFVVTMYVRHICYDVF